MSAGGVGGSVGLHNGGCMRRIAAVCLWLVCCLTAVVARASAPLEVSPLMGKAAWGATPAEVLADYREQMMARFRQASAGVADPLRVEELRKDVDASLKRAAESLAPLESERTGYEVSVIGGEVFGQKGMSLMTIRPTASLTGNFHYLVFSEGRLAKVLIAYPLMSIDFMPLDQFMSSQSEAYGAPDEVEFRRNENGVKLLRQATWSDGVTRIRLLERRADLQSHLVVLEDATKPVISELIDPSIKPRRSVEDLLGGEGEGPVEQPEQIEEGN